MARGQWLASGYPVPVRLFRQTLDIKIQAAPVSIQPLRKKN